MHIAESVAAEIAGNPTAKQTVELAKRYQAAYQKQLASGTAQVEGPFTEGQRKYVPELAKLTGLDPRFVGAWVLQEANGEAAQSGWDGKGYYNYLNVGPWHEDPAFSDPVSAAKWTADFINQKTDYAISPTLSAPDQGARGQVGRGGGGSASLPRYGAPGS